MNHENSFGAAQRYPTTSILVLLPDLVSQSDSNVYKRWCVQYTMLLNCNLCCCMYSTIATGSRFLKSLDPCFVIVLLIISCQSTKSVQLPGFLLFAHKKLTVFRMFLEFGLNFRPRIEVSWATDLSRLSMSLCSTAEKEMTSLICAWFL